MHNMLQLATMHGFLLECCYLFYYAIAAGDQLHIVLGTA
jgi:hypothetical protein